jgi:hypothetical protein
MQSGTERSTRRRFCRTAAGVWISSARLLHGASFAFQSPAQSPFNAVRPDVASIDRDRILSGAQHALQNPPTPPGRIPPSPGASAPQQYFSEAAPSGSTDTPPDSGRPLFTAHRDALFALGLAIPALVCAWRITGERRYADAAAQSLRQWFVTPGTRMQPNMDLAQVSVQSAPGRPRTGASEPPPSLAPDNSPSQNSGSSPEPNPKTTHALQGSYQGIVEALPLVEIAQAIPFLGASGALLPYDIAGLQSWFGAYLAWLTAEQDSGPRLQALARDSKDHNATSWLLQVAALTRFTLSATTEPRAEDASMTALRHRFRSVTLRSQVAANGSFPHEIETPNPYRNSLFNLDMMACICDLLSTRFESAWDYQLEDGPGMRVAAAFHVPFIQNRSRWPYRADAAYFNQLPSRRPSLLLSGRAYDQPEYVALWRSLSPDPSEFAVLQSIPIHQPLLWVTQPPSPARPE